MNKRVKKILDFWFIECSMKDYFKKDPNFDNKIKINFEKDYIKAINNDLEEWQDSPESCLALVIVLDQFSRNLFRNNKNAYKFDKKTRLIVNEGIDRGDLEEMSNEYILFFLLPLIHSEEISDHIFAHKLSKTYLKDHKEYKLIKKSWDDHTNVIKKFSRYPHRNKILNRENTTEENKFLSNSNISW
tara:strand:- start:93 stop:653 length:561 start_codon:yes stop_codon:yes gene_type:complete